MKRIAVALLALLAFLQYRLWLGEGGLVDTWQMENSLQRARASNEALEESNQRLKAKVHNLRVDLNVIEELARKDLGMVKRGEKFYLIVAD